MVKKTAAEIIVNMSQFALSELEAKNRYTSFHYSNGVMSFCKYTNSFWMLDLIDEFIKAKLTKPCTRIKVNLSIRKNSRKIVFFNKVHNIFHKDLIDDNLPLGQWSFYLIKKNLYLKEEFEHYLKISK